MMRRLALGLAGLLWIGMSAAAAWALPGEHTPSRRPNARQAFQEGYRQQTAGRFTAAIHSYETSLEDDPHQAEALNNIGVCYKRLKEYQRAIRYYKDALALDPKLAEAHEHLAEAYLAIGKMDLAKRECDLLRALSPNDANELEKQINAAGTAPATTR